MPSAGHGPNVIEVTGRPMLLTATSSGVAVHLATVADEPGSGREAVHDVHFDDANGDEDRTMSGYDRTALTAPLWSRTTLCGREWAVMVGGDGGPVVRNGDVAFAPTCRRCLALIDRHFPAPKPDSRLALVAGLAADVVVDQRGFAEIHGVPGDQQAELRRTVRRLIRQRTNQSVRTFVAGGNVYVECPEIHAEKVGQGAPRAPAALDAVALDAAFAGELPPRAERDWVISWQTWDLG
ncbi:hypothetical protein [Cryptosporangium aurantiacum]|uniref:Uncharacterized protein n=1 Tax=Cryptosporangium aurantiacum TaxID=134849 RepID=A0A1M7Q496_9ACTN|nr:hypothetical protein [Cryptosporangium aurantiacum]SHN24958.1 hypothetical protein SAMN05443668_104109 [Cryptosporangium aurantiacum]